MLKAPNSRFLGKTCNICGIGKLAETEDFNEWWVKCDDCGHLVFCYVPMPHQLEFHKDPARFKMYAGGFGSAKTSTCGAEFISLALSTPNGEGLVGAMTYPQLEKTAKKQILDMIPIELIENYNQQKNELKLTNGYTILFRSFDDEQKLRSLNLCHVWIEEANGISFDIFTQLQTRLRHYATSQHKIIMSTNPDGNWIRTEFLLKSKRIVGSDIRYPQKTSEINPNYSTHIASTKLNQYLPKGYIETVSSGKPDWWVRRYINGSFENAEGAVYPNFARNIEYDLTYEEVVNNIRTKGWKVIGGADFGLLDPTVLLLGAIDPVNGIIYIYDEYYRNRVAIPTHAHEMKLRMQHIPFGSLLKLVGDPSGKKRNISDRKSIFSNYAEHNIFFSEGNNRIEAGIQKVFTYLEFGKLKVLARCEKTIEEHLNYMYKPVELGEPADEKPVDGNDHTCDSLRYMINELPDDPFALATESYHGRDFYRPSTKSEEHLPFALQTEDEHIGGKDDWYHYY